MVEKMPRKVKTTSDLGVNSIEVELAAEQMSELDNQIQELNRGVDEIKRKFTEGTISQSDLDELKKKADVVAQNFLPLETRLQWILQKFQVGKVPASLIPYSVFGGKVYSARLRELLVQAYDVIYWPDAPKRISWWLSKDQQLILPHEYDLLAGIYYKIQSHERANATSLQGFIRGWNKGKISSEARALIKRRWVQKTPGTAAPTGGRHAINWELADRGLKLVRGSSGPTFSKDPKTYEAMKQEILMNGIVNSPPIVHMWVTQIPGERDRCDAIVLARDPRNWGKYDMDSPVEAINIETPADVSKQPERVYTRMIMPFAYGADHLEIFYQVSSYRKLKKLWGKLPKWLQKQIDLTPVE
jgi:hypothetical protein